MTSKFVAFAVALGFSSIALGNSCVDRDLWKVEEVLKNHLNHSAVKVSPALAFEGMSKAQQDQMGARGTLLFANEAIMDFKRTANAFISSNGNSASTALAAFNSGNVRQSLKVLRRPRNNAAAVPNQTQNCAAGQCEFSFKTEQLFLAPNMRSSQIVNGMTAYRLTHNSVYKVYFCQVGEQCSGPANVQSAGGRTSSTGNPSPMRIGSNYLVREHISGWGAPETNVVTLFKVTPIEFCGREGFVYTGSLVPASGSSFAHASSYTIVIEGANGSMAYSLTQATDPTGNANSVKTAYGKTIMGSNVSSLGDQYNSIAEKIGMRDRVDKRTGILK